MSAKDKSFFLKPRFLKISSCFSLIVFLLAFGACRTPQKTEMRSLVPNNAVAYLEIEDLAKTAQAVPEDKVQWRALDNGRTVLDLLGEAAQAAGLGAELARSRGESKISPEIFQNWKPERAAWTREIALEKLAGGTRELLAAIEELSDEELDRDVTMMMHQSMTYPLSVWLLLPYRSFISRMAQINYIQTLYGDFDFH